MVAAPTEHASGATAAPPVVRTVALDAWFGSTHAVRGVSLDVPERQVTAIIGPSGCGKSTLLRCLNRMHETIPGARVRGDVWLAGQNIYAAGTNAIRVRRLVGMVFQRPTPFPTMSIRDNVAAGLRVSHNGTRPRRSEVDAIVERALRRTALWDEVKDRLNAAATDLSGGQQQRCCWMSRRRRSTR
jgi:phosphate transport system ATP-binding protein